MTTPKQEQLEREAVRRAFEAPEFIEQTIKGAGVTLGLTPAQEEIAAFASDGTSFETIAAKAELLEQHRDRLVDKKESE